MKKILRLPEIAWRFGGKGPVKKSLLLVYFFWFSFTRKMWLRDVPYTFTIIANNKLLHLSLWNNVDLATFIEVFLDEEYKWNNIGVPKNIVDAGANIGLTSLYYAHKYEDIDIYALEPSPVTYNRLKYNTQHHPGIHTIQAALSNKDGEDSFFVSDNSIGCSIKKREGYLEKITIRTYNFHSFLEEYKLNTVDLLKFDIEGSEVDVFDDSFDYSLVKYYIGEVHEDIIGIEAQKFARRFPSDYYKLTSTGVSGRYILKSSNELMKGMID